MEITTSLILNVVGSIVAFIICVIAQPWVHKYWQRRKGKLEDEKALRMRLGRLLNNPASIQAFSINGIYKRLKMFSLVVFSSFMAYFAYLSFSAAVDFYSAHWISIACAFFAIGAMSVMQALRLLKAIVALAVELQFCDEIFTIVEKISLEEYRAAKADTSPSSAETKAMKND